MSGKITPELRLKKLRRLEHNVICPNCGTAAPQGLGFGNVCVKFNTFICDLCKTSHQAISHRVKSITMSNWTNDEVNALTAEYGGGNEAALHIWLQNAPAFGGKYRGGSRPKEGDRIEIFKNFVSDCYDKGMFRATTPFVPNSTPQAAPVAKQSAAPAAKPTPSAASAGSVNHSGGHPVNPVRLSKPVETVDFFDTSSSTGTDPFASGGAFGDASPKPPARNAFDPFGAHSNFSSSTDLFGAGAGVGATNSTSGSVQGTAAAKPNTSTSDLLFDAFNDTPSPTPPPTTHHQNSSHNSQGFPAFPSQFPPAPGPAQASTSSGFDFIEGDPFSAPSTVGGAGINTFSSFDSFSSQAAVAPSHHHHHHNSHNSHHHHHQPHHHHSQNSGGASGFDFLDQGQSNADPFAAPRSAGSSITSSNMNSATNSVVNSAFASQTDLFALSTSSAAAALSAPSPVPAHTASTASAAVPPPVQVHDPFGSVFLQPTLTGGSTSSGYASGHASGHASPTPSSPYTPQSVGSVGAGSSMNGGMSGGMSGIGGGMNGLNRNGASPVPSMGSMGGGIGYGAHPSMGGGPSPMNMGMGMGMGMGQQAYQPMGAPVQYRASPSAPAPFAPAPYATGHAQPQRVDAIGDAFSSLNFGGANAGTRPGQPQPSSQQHQQASSFDFLQTTVKQQLPPTAPTGRSATTSPMGQGMSQGMNQGMNPGMGQSMGMGMGGYQQRPAGQHQHQHQQYPPQR